MEARDLEREEMKVQLEALQTYKTKGAQPVEPAQLKQMSKDMNSKSKIGFLIFFRTCAIKSKRSKQCADRDRTKLSQR